MDPRVRADKAAQVFGAVEEVDSGRDASSQQETQRSHLQPARHREPHHHTAGPAEKERGRERERLSMDTTKYSIGTDCRGPESDRLTDQLQLWLSSHKLCGERRVKRSRRRTGEAGHARDRTQQVAAHSPTRTQQDTSTTIIRDTRTLTSSQYVS